MLLFSFYGVSFGVLGMPWSIPAVMLISTALVVRFIGFGNVPTDRVWGIAGGFALYTVFAFLLGFYFDAIARQNRKRREIIAELETTRSELARAERQAGTLEERQRLAGEIHDTLAQGLTSIVMTLEAAEGALDADPALARQHLGRAKQVARENLAEARRFVWALRPETLEREPLAQALQRVAERWSGEVHIPLHFAVTGTAAPLPSTVEVTLLRATQEALENVRKHARATQVNVTLSFIEDQVALDVQDDGQGFTLQPTTPQAGGQGFGLDAMHRRAEQLGGTLAVESAPGEGTVLSLVLPSEALTQPAPSPEENSHE